MATDTDTQEFTAKHRYARISPRKARYVMDQIRGKPINEAINILDFSNRRGAHFIGKVLHSALANAEHLIMERGLTIDVDDLYVSTGKVDEGPTWKRHRPRARGRAFPIHKRTSHITVCLKPAEKKEEE